MNRSRSRAGDDCGIRCSWFWMLLVLICLPSAVVEAAAPLDVWTVTNTLTETNPNYAITFANNQFVMVGSLRIHTSTTGGPPWNTTTIAASLNGVAYGNGRFVAVGDHTGTSPDGLSWTLVETYTILGGITNWLEGVAYGNNTFVAVGRNGRILTSPDGNAWATPTSGTTLDLKAVAYGNNTFVAVGGGVILTSTDGKTMWTSRSVSWGSIGDGRAITYADNKFVLVAGTNSVRTSPDGATWSAPCLWDRRRP